MKGTGRADISLNDLDDLKWHDKQCMLWTVNVYHAASPVLTKGWKSLLFQINYINYINKILNSVFQRVY